MTTLAEAPPIQARPRVAKRPVRVVVAEDHPLYRMGLVRSLTERSFEIAIVGECDNGIDALALIDALEPDVALLDLRMPGVDGIEVCEHLAFLDDPPRTKLLLLSAFDDAELVWRAVQSGAAGYLDKRASHDAICEAVLRVADGGIAFTPSTAAGVNSGFGLQR